MHFNKQLVSYCLLPVTLALFGDMGSNISYAMQCDEPHQGNITDSYYDLDKSELEQETYLGLNDLAEHLDGRWQGTALEVNCGVADTTPLARIENYEIDAEISQHHLGSIIVRAQKESRRKVQLENLFIAPEIERDMERQRQGDERHFPSYSIEFSSPNKMVFDHKYRAFKSPPYGQPPFVASHVPGKRGTRLIHEIKTVSLDNNLLTISRDVYVNGYFVSQQEWQLKKQ